VKGEADGASKRKTWCAPSSKPVANRPPSVEVPVNRMKSNEAVEPIVPVRMSFLIVEVLNQCSCLNSITSELLKRLYHKEHNHLLIFCVF
jgi:hypothetical protein